MSGKLTKPALNPEEPTLVVACPWGGGDRERDRTPVCPCRLYQCLHTSELTSRLVGHFRPRRQAQG